MAYNEKLIQELVVKAKMVRKDSVEMLKAAGYGWIAGSFSQADIITALVFHHMKHDPQNPQWENRDRLIISKAHCCETVYAALGEAGYFSKKEFMSYGRLGGLLQAHTERTVPGIEYSGGSLGQGLSFAFGEALGARIGMTENGSGRPIPRFRVFCIVGDRECDEGQIWEAALTASHYQVDNLTAFVDYNELQSSGDKSDRLNLETLAERWRAFGWKVTDIDGHNLTEILGALERTDKITGKPKVIIAHTVKSKGVPSFECRNLHFCKFTDDMYAEAIKELQ